jgi:hypothetical protein
MDAARKRGRHGHRDATMILVAFRHGLRPSEVCTLRCDMIDLARGLVHVRRAKNGTPSAQGQIAAAAAVAQTNVLLLRPQGGRAQIGYSADAGAWDADVRTPTRLSNDSMRIRLGKLIDGAVRPWAEADPPWRAWALSEVAIRVGRIAAEDAGDPLIAAAVETAKARWPVAERGVPLIALHEQDGAWAALARNSSSQVIRVRYSRAIGLSFD